jgi:membrane associated rhomboid family serine protease
MIPFRDNIPSRTFPFVNVSLIVLNVLAFFYELSLGRAIVPFVETFGVIPARVTLASELPISLSAVVIPFFTSIFLHGGWMHLIGNMWYLWIFGDNVEDRLGHTKYLLFYLLCGIGASVAHIFSDPGSFIPSIGASGAIAGVLGAYLVSYPHARILTLVPLFIFIEFIELPALLVLGMWFVIQFLSGAMDTSPAGQATGGVAWWAHIGGFLIGMLLLMLFRPRPRQPRIQPQTWRRDWE